MAPPIAAYAPNLAVFLRALKEKPLESNIEYLIALLRRRQIRNSRPCAIATIELLKRVVSKFRWSTVALLLKRIEQVGERLIQAQPKEVAVGNIVKRVLGMIRLEAKEGREENTSEKSGSQASSPRRQLSGFGPDLNARPYGISSLRNEALSGAPSGREYLNYKGGDSGISGERASRPPLMTSHTSYAVLNGLPVQQSMFNLLSATNSPLNTPPGTASPMGRPSMSATSLSSRLSDSTTNLKAEIIGGIEEIIDELYQVDDQIATFAPDHIHTNEIILISGSSRTVQTFLLKAAEKRKFTVIHIEAYPNDHMATYDTIMGKVSKREQDSDDNLSSDDFEKPLTALGVTIILITDAAVFAMMSRVNKVILGTHAVIANGGLVAPAGAKIIAKAAHKHRVPVIVLSGIYKLSPDYPFEFESMIEFGDPGKVLGFDDGHLIDTPGFQVENPLYDYVPPELVDLYITNLGAHAPSYLYRVVADHYNTEDTKREDKV